MEEPERWQLSGSAAELYERYTVAWMFEPLARQLIERLPLRSGSRVLDVACGTGIVARLAASRVAPDGRAVGVDINAGMLTTARKVAHAAGLDIEFGEGDANALAFPDAAFDAVLCQQGLQFFLDRAGALREMRRVLAPHGTIGIAVWGDPGPFTRSLADALSRHIGPKVGLQCLAPFALSNPQLLRGLADESGLAGAELRTVSLIRRVEPTQDWLIKYSSGLPYGEAVAAMSAAARAEVVRHVASSLKPYWDTDHFAVPQDNHLLYFTDNGRKGP
jgi:SAM-dependent methyltransferase